MARVLSPLLVAVILLVLALSAAGASLPIAESALGETVASLMAAQPRMLMQSEVVIVQVPILPSTSTYEPVTLIVSFALLAAAGAFILTVRRRMS
jgi:hypothetical protein